MQQAGLPVRVGKLVGSKSVSCFEWVHDDEAVEISPIQYFYFEHQQI